MSPNSNIKEFQTMRKVLLSLFLASALCASAQQPGQPVQPAGSNWHHVEVLPIGASISVKSRDRQQNCTLKSVDADTLTCTHGKDFVFQRTEILTIKIPHRGRSALIGTAIGAGTGAIIGFASTSSSCDADKLCFITRDAVAAVASVVGGGIGALTGALSDFSHSTVYKAP
jgi:hypothetical protein